MAKTKEETNRKDVKHPSIIIDIILILLLLTLSGLNILFILKNNKLVPKNNELNQKLLLANSNYEQLLIQNNLLTERNQLLTDLTNQVNIAKEDFFKTAKLFEDKVANKEINYKIAYLTFDDGPYYNTYKVFDTLEKHDILATFFTTNVNGTSCYDNHSYNCQNLYKEYVKRGHTIANHTYTHNIWGKSFGGVYYSADSFIWNIEKQEELVKNLTGGYITNITRFPGGSPTAGNLKNSIMQKLRDKGYGWVDWSAQDGDGGWVGDTTTAWNNLKPTINEDIEVVLFHDYSTVTLAIIPDFIKYLEDNNYVLLPLFYESKMINK